MPKESGIVDIRYFACGELPFTDGHSPGNLQSLYAFPKSVHAIGARIARKLRELGYTIPGYDHVYIVFTPVQAARTVRPSRVVLESWQRHFSVGADPAQVGALDGAEREGFVVDATLRVLRRIAGADACKRAMLRQVGREIARDGENLEIFHREFSSKALQARVSYRIHASGMRGSGWIEIEERATGRRARQAFVDLDAYDDLYALVDRVTVTKGVVTMTPRKSASAGMVVRRYQTPMRVNIEALLTGKAIGRYLPRPARR